MLTTSGQSAAMYPSWLSDSVQTAALVATGALVLTNLSAAASIGSRSRSQSLHFLLNVNQYQTYDPAQFDCAQFVPILFSSDITTAGARHARPRSSPGRCLQPALAHTRCQDNSSHALRPDIRLIEAQCSLSIGLRGHAGPRQYEHRTGMATDRKGVGTIEHGGRTNQNLVITARQRFQNLSNLSSPGWWADGNGDAGGHEPDRHRATTRAYGCTQQCRQFRGHPSRHTCLSCSTPFHHSANYRRRYYWPHGSSRSGRQRNNNRRQWKYRYRY